MFLPPILPILKIIPQSFYLVIFAVLAVAGGLFVWRGKIITDERAKCTSEAVTAQNDAMSKKLEEMRQYVLFLENGKNKTAEFVKRQKKAANDAKDEDGPVAPVLRNGLERLRHDTNLD